MSLKNAHVNPGREKRNSFHHVQRSAPNPTPIFFLLYLPVTPTLTCTTHTNTSIYPPAHFFLILEEIEYLLFNSFTIPLILIFPPFCLPPFNPPTPPHPPLSCCSVGAVSGVCSDTHSQPQQQAGPCALKGSG